MIVDALRAESDQANLHPRSTADEARDLLRGLDCKYGGTIHKGQLLVSNDGGWESDTIPHIIGAKRNLGQRGLGLFVGSGGVMSLLPDLPIEIPVVIDRNRAVLEVSSIIETLIAQHSTADEVLAELDSVDFQDEHPTLEQYCRRLDPPGHHRRRLTNSILYEAGEFGNYHWTNPNRFQSVKYALEHRPIVHIGADIREPILSEDLAKIAELTGQPITFVNLTNVHQWIKPNNMEFTRKFPISDDAIIAFSSHFDETFKDEAGLPVSRLALNLTEYIDFANMDPMDISYALSD